MTSPNRPPSCDKLAAKINDCPLCGSTSVRHERLIIIKCTNNNCNLYGPNDDPQGHKWNSIPHRSEVAELLRLVDGLRSSVNTGSPEWYAAYATLMTYADKLRKEWKLWEIK